jgi:Zn-dependent peptidase ImmA (M78 family)
MEKEKFYRILEFNRINKKEISTACMQFYAMINRQNAFVIPDIQSLAKMLFTREDYKFVHIPLNSKEIGACQLRMNGQRYLVINTSKSLANNNFAVAHDLYHLMIQEYSSENGIEVYLDNYDEDKNEMYANAFAGNIMMPSEDFIQTASFIKNSLSLGNKEEDKAYLNELTMIINLMEYYKTTYMSVVIRFFELELWDKNDARLIDALLYQNNEDDQRKIFVQLSKAKGRNSIMEPTKEDDFEILMEEAKVKAKKLLELGIMTKQDFDYRLRELKGYYVSVKGDIR